MIITDYAKSRFMYHCGVNDFNNELKLIDDESIEVLSALVVSCFCPDSIKDGDYLSVLRDDARAKYVFKCLKKAISIKKIRTYEVDDVLYIDLYDIPNSFLSRMDKNLKKYKNGKMHLYRTKPQTDYIAEIRELIDGTDDILYLLSDRYLKILNAYSVEEKTLEEVSTEFNISVERVRQIITRSVYRLRNNKL